MKSFRKFVSDMDENSGGNKHRTSNQNTISGTVTLNHRHQMFGEKKPQDFRLPRSPPDMINPQTERSMPKPSDWTWNALCWEPVSNKPIDGADIRCQHLLLNCKSALNHLGINPIKRLEDDEIAAGLWRMSGEGSWGRWGGGRRKRSASVCPSRRTLMIKCGGNFLLNKLRVSGCHSISDRGSSLRGRLALKKTTTTSKKSLPCVEEMQPYFAYISTSQMIPVCYTEIDPRFLYRWLNICASP